VAAGTFAAYRAVTETAAAFRRPIQITA